MYILLVFAKNLIFALFAEFQPKAIVVLLSTTDSVISKSQHRFLLKFLFFRTFFFSLELLATLLKAGSDSDNVLFQPLDPEPFLNAKRK